MNLGTFLEKAAGTYTTDIALEYGNEKFDFQRMNQRVNRFANGLIKMGLRKGDRVAIMLKNGPRLAETLFSCFKAGFTAVPINAKLHPQEFRYIVSNAQARGLVIGGEFHESYTLVSHAARYPKFTVCTSDDLIGTSSFDEVVEMGSGEEPEADVEKEATAWLFYTSGTTGRPKGAMLSHRSLISMSMNFLSDVCDASRNDLALHAAPLTHGSGLYMLPLISRGVRNIILPSRFDPKSFLRTVEKKRITILPFLAPTMIKMLLFELERGNYDLRSLRCLVYGGSPIYPEDLREALRRFGNVMVQVYGQGEAPMTISYLGNEAHILAEDNSRLGSAGIPRTDVEVKIFDGRDKEVASGETGEICVRGDVVMDGYWRNAKATRETMRNGWLHTGDLGYADELGYLYIKDRKNDVIIRGGSNIYPREVEEAILRHPAVQEVAVVGVQDPLWGEAVKAFVVLKRGSAATEDEITGFCKQHIAGFKKPKTVEFINSLPKNAYGKVLRRALISS